MTGDVLTLFIRSHLTHPPGDLQMEVRVGARRQVKKREERRPGELRLRNNEFISTAEPAPVDMWARVTAGQCERTAGCSATTTPENPVAMTRAR